MSRQPPSRTSIGLPGADRNARERQARSRSAPAPALSSAVAALLAAAIGAWTFRGALAFGFSQDDFLGLARATGHAARLPFGWRWLSHQLWWDLVAGPLHADPYAAHALSLALHATITALLAWLLARRLGAPAALVGAAFVASHPSAYTAIYWAAANGDLVATLGSLGAVGVALSSRARWLALPLFALALLAKESALPVPLAWWAIAALWPGQLALARPPWRDPVWLGGVALAVAFVLGTSLGARGPALGGEAYRLSAGAIAGNVLTYDGWLVNRWFATVRSFADSVDPGAFAWGVALNLAWLAGALVPALRRAGWVAAGVAWSAMLLPVLPLANHTYHYYLYPALPAAGLLLAALASVALARAGRATAWVAALVVAGAFALDGARLVTRIETMPFKVEGLRSDAIVDRARIAENALGDLRAAALPPHTRLRLWSPQAQGMAAREGVPADREGYYERNVRGALLDGLAIRVRVPEVDSAWFVRAFDPSDSLAWWAVYRYDGHLRALRAGALARLIAAMPR